MQERLAVEAFLGAIPWPLSRGIHSRRIASLQKALEEARLMQMLDEEEEDKGRFRHSQKNLGLSRDRSDDPLAGKKGGSPCVGMRRGRSRVTQLRVVADVLAGEAPRMPE